MDKLVPMGVLSPYTSEQMARILQCVTTNKERVEKIVVGAASDYVRELSLPKIPRPNPAREIAGLNQALQSLVRALGGLSSETREILDGPERRDPAYRHPSIEPMDCAALSNSVHRFLIENKIVIEMEVRNRALPGRSKVSAKRQLLDRLVLAFAIGHGAPRPQGRKAVRPQGRPAFLNLCGSPINLQNTGAGNWWDDLNRKKPSKKRRN
jgi:hypothetical protein